MIYTNNYYSPLGKILLAADDKGLIGLWFEGQKYFAAGLDKNSKDKDLIVFETAKNWLDIYFSGKEPDFKIPLDFRGTEFQNKVWKLLCSVPYGKTVTYGELAEQIAGDNGRKYAQAVGNAIGKNPVSIIVPCHRAVGSNGSLTGYAGGIDKKIKLLKLEGSFKEEFFIPKNLKSKK